MDTAEKRRYTTSEYFEFEEMQEGKFEYHDGLIVSMAGGTKRHIRICMKLGNILDRLLEDSSCTPYTFDLRVKSEKHNSYYYPGCTVVCEEENNGDETIETKPVVIFEVLSKSTESYDRGTKLEAYCSISSLQAYLLVSQNEPKVEMYSRTEHGEFWTYVSLIGLEKEIEIESIGVRLQLSEVYKTIVFK